VQAAKNAGVGEDCLSRCQSIFSERARQVETSLLKSAQSEPLSCLVAPIIHAWALQQQGTVSKTVQVTTQRARVCCTTLRSSLSFIADSLCTLQPATTSAGCERGPVLPCLAATLHHFRFSPHSSQKTYSAAEHTASVAVKSDTKTMNGFGRTDCPCALCIACKDIPDALHEAHGLCLCQLAMYAVTALLWGIYRYSLGAFAFKRKAEASVDYYGWIKSNPAGPASDTGHNAQDDQLVASFKAQCALCPITRTTDAAVLCSSSRLMLGFRQFQEHQIAPKRQAACSDQVHQQVPMAKPQSQNVVEGALELSEVLLQSILGALFEWPSLPNNVCNHLPQVHAVAFLLTPLMRIVEESWLQVAQATPARGNCA
jgi:hypothetical protein